MRGSLPEWGQGSEVYRAVALSVNRSTEVVRSSHAFGHCVFFVPGDRPRGVHAAAIRVESRIAKKPNEFLTLRIQISESAVWLAPSASMTKTEQYIDADTPPGAAHAFALAFVEFNPQQHPRLHGWKLVVDRWRLATSTQTE
jgi:hypothetical protein